MTLIEAIALYHYKEMIAAYAHDEAEKEGHVVLPGHVIQYEQEQFFISMMREALMCAEDAIKGLEPPKVEG